MNHVTICGLIVSILCLAAAAAPAATVWMDAAEVDALGQTLDDACVRMYADNSKGAETLTVNTTGFPTPSATPHIPLATILTAAGEYDFADIIDHRARAMYSVLG